MLACLVCKEKTPLRCDRCRAVSYCKTECQISDWHQHQAICGKLEELYADVLWVRGTNSSIFLSCYHENGKWLLLSKGDQFRRGFVPMSETVDNGILNTSGVNFYFISAYVKRGLRGSAEYAMKVAPFQFESTVALLEPPKRSYPSQQTRQHFLQEAIGLMRLKQFDGAMTPRIKEVLQRIESVPVDEYNSAEAYMERANMYENLLIFINADLPRPAPGTLYYTDFRAYLEQTVQQFGLPFWRYAMSSPIEGNDGVRDWIKNPERAITRFVGEKESIAEYVVPRILQIKSVLEPEEYASYVEILTEFVSKALANIRLALKVAESATSDRPPVYKLNQFDKSLITEPFPLIVASSNASTNYQAIRAGGPELKIPSPTELSPNAANIIIVREVDYPRAQALLAKLKINVRLIADDWAFQT